MAQNQIPPLPETSWAHNHPPRKRTGLKVFLVVAGVLALLVVVGIAAAVRDANRPRVVSYQITGTSQAASLVTYTTNGSTATEQFRNAAIPWTKTFEITGGTLYQVMVQNSARDEGTVVCTIRVDGEVVATQTGDGPATIAHCTAEAR